MKKVIALSLPAMSALGFAFLLHAAPSVDRALRVDITSPADGARRPWNSQVPYAVTASYDGKSTRFGELPANSIVLRAAYVPDVDAPAAQRSPPLPDALVQISQSNCTGCHDFSASSSGPSFAAIGKRYGRKPSAVPTLAAHIKNGSSGSWGAGIMPPHPDLSPAQASAIAKWIVTLASDPAVHYSVGKSGSFRMSAQAKPSAQAGMVLSAFYTGPLRPGEARTGTGRNLVVVRGY